MADFPKEFAEGLFNSPLLRVFKDIARLKEEPRVLVVITNAFLELAINLMIEEKCKEAKKIVSSNRDYPYAVKLTILYEAGVLSDHHFRLLNWFRKLRNDAAHEAFFELKQDDFTDFEKPEHRDLSKFHTLCTVILIDLLKSYGQIIGPGIVPIAYERVDEDVLMFDEPSHVEMLPLKSDPKRLRRSTAEAEADPHSLIHPRNRPMITSGPGNAADAS